MVADACDSLRVRLRALETELKDSQPVPGERHPPKPPPNLNGLISQIATTRDQLNACVESLMIRRWTVTGNTFLGAFAIDRAIKRFMFDHDIRALSVAIAMDGVVTVDVEICVLTNHDTFTLGLGPTTFAIT
jgi:hypothetical protein